LIILMEIKRAGMNLHRRRKGDILWVCVYMSVYTYVLRSRDVFSMSSRSLRADVE